eukprot:1665382-Heterocapsa_arctica.AAC.1
MRKHLILVTKDLENSIEGARLYYTLENTGTEAIKELETKVDSLRCKLKTERTSRWRNWGDNSWNHKKTNI